MKLILQQLLVLAFLNFPPSFFPRKSYLVLWVNMQIPPGSIPKGADPPNIILDEILTCN